MHPIIFGHSCLWKLAVHNTMIETQQLIISRKQSVCYEGGQRAKMSFSRKRGESFFSIINLLNMA